MKSHKSATDIREQLRSLGMRATTARLAVCKVLVAAEGPLTHGELADRLEDSGVDRTTVFRNLTDLCKAGLVRRFEVGDHIYRFEWRTGAQGDAEHPHFVCVDCGEVQCLKTAVNPSLPRPRQRDEHIHDVIEVLYRGHCSTCAD